MISMPSDVNCTFSTVSIANFDDLDGKRVDTKVKWITLLILMANLTISYFKRLVLIDGKVLFTQP